MVTMFTGCGFIPGFGNFPPSAYIVVDPESIGVGETATLDGSDSSDQEDGSSLNYSWRITGFGEGSILNENGISDRKSSIAYFVADVPGTFVIQLTVTDSAGESDSASISIDVHAVDSHDTTLSALSLSTGVLSPTFAPGTLFYTAGVQNSVSSVTVLAVASHANAVVTGDGLKNLDVGENILTVTVTAEDGFTSMNYIIVVSRAGPSSYFVIYDGNGSDGGTVPADGAAYEEGAAVTVAAPGTMTRTGYAFTEWNEVFDGSSTGHAAGSTLTMGTANITLYAQWTTNPTFMVYYDGNGSDGGTVPTDTVAYDEGAAVTVAAPGTMTRTGHAFTGWNEVFDGSGTGHLVGSTFTIGSSHITLYAQWQEGLAPTDEALILNGDFAYGELYWELFTVLGANTFAVEGEAAVLDTPTAGDNFWDTQLTYAGPSFTMENGEFYEVLFKTWGIDRSAYICIQENNRDLNGDGSLFTKYKTEQFFAQEAVSENRYLFYMNNPDDDNPYFGFQTAGETGTLYLDDISLKKYGPIDPYVNMLPNGDFSYGTSLWSPEIDTNLINPATDIGSFSIQDELYVAIYYGGGQQNALRLVRGADEYLEFEQNTYYELSFDALADNRGWISVLAEENGTDYNGDGNNYSDYWHAQQIYLDSSIRTVRKIFLMQNVTGGGKLIFKLGGNDNIDFFMDNVVLKKITMGSIDPLVNMLRDGGVFDDGAVCWSTYVTEEIRDSVSIEDMNGEINISMGENVVNQWINLQYGKNCPLYFENGKAYKISFDAYGADNYIGGQLELEVEEDGKDYDGDGNTQTKYSTVDRFFPLTAVSQRFEFSFAMENPTGNGVINFEVYGIDNSAVIIDNVVVQEFTLPGTYDGNYSGSSVFTESTTGEQPGDPSGDWTMTVSGDNAVLTDATGTWYGNMEQLTGEFVFELTDVDDGFGNTYSWYTSGTIALDGAVNGYWRVDFSTGDYQAGTLSGTADL